MIRSGGPVLDVSRIALELCALLELDPADVRSVTIGHDTLTATLYSRNGDGEKWIDRDTGTVALETRQFPITTIPPAGDELEGHRVEV